MENFSVEIIETEGDYISFKLLNGNNFLANIFRRVMMMEVPSLAIHEISIQKNQSVLVDDILSERLGLVVLYSGSIVNNLKIECNCESGHCENCAIPFRLEASNKEYEHVAIDTKSIKIDNPDVFPVPFIYKLENEVVKFPITVINLGKDHGINLSGYIRKGNGEMNAKWNPVCTVVYDKEGDDFIFNVEVTGTLYPSEVVSSAERIIRDLMNEGELKPPKPK